MKNTTILLYEPSQTFYHRVPREMVKHDASGHVFVCCKTDTGVRHWLRATFLRAATETELKVKVPRKLLVAAILDA